ncbi:SMI1/KNR4 family protein [Bacillus sp. WMMC1349]|uniref:SMI1/KNR4 family protein n=1 Tax=Bacillus sp. WMMC1349 TaxID=2736254 RepID=UPI0015537DF8|nr:SMI1/KNR4 family protein [Bacillus sp. WMMC1349]NPC93630.1 SMI1/KNR4 family protein [Bacillus sp. WMMC1349]
MEQKIDYLRKFNKSARIISKDEVDDIADLIPNSWLGLFKEDNVNNRINMLLGIWRKYVEKELSTTINYLTNNLENIELLEIEGRRFTRYSILYTIKKPNSGVTYYEGRNPQEDFYNDELEKNWFKFPESIRKFYENVHNGFYYYASVSMGLEPLESVTFLGDDDFDWSIIDDLKEPMQIDLNTSFGFFSNGMGSYIALDYKNCNNENATFWSAKTQPRYNINFWDHVDEWIVIGFE